MKIFEIRMIGHLVIERLMNLKYRVDCKKTGLTRCFDTLEEAMNPRF